MYVSEVETRIRVTLGERRDIRLHCQCYSKSNEKEPKTTMNNVYEQKKHKK